MISSVRFLENVPLGPYQKDVLTIMLEVLLTQAVLAPTRDNRIFGLIWAGQAQAYARTGSGTIAHIEVACAAGSRAISDRAASETLKKEVAYRTHYGYR